MAATLESVGVVLRVAPFGEADLVATLLTAQFGKRSFFARGARKSSRRFGGGLHPLSTVRARFKERSGSDLDLLTEAETLWAATELGSRLGAYAASAASVEATHLMLADHQGEPHHYERLVRLLDWLGDATRPDALLWVGLNRYLHALLEDHGVVPDWESVGSGDRPGAAAVVAALAPQVGLAPRMALASLPGAVGLRQGEVDYLSALALARVPDASLWSLGAPVGRVLHAMTSWQAHRTLQSWDFVEQTLGRG